VVAVLAILEKVQQQLLDLAQRVADLAAAERRLRR
jgi:hypothetical protein